MDQHVTYFNLTKQESEATFGTIVEILIKSRVEAKATQGHCDDEDVNTYLAGVLLGYIDPTYHQAIGKVISNYDLDVHTEATRDNDAYRKYWVYKVNADDRLLSLGIFQPSDASSSGRLEQTSTYYGFASGFNHRIYRKSTAVSDILDKLSQRTERYVGILLKARQEYLRFVETLSEEQLKDFTQKLSEQEQDQAIKAQQDTFLDLYSVWQRTQDGETKAKLIQQMRHLRQIDPSFEGPQV